MRGNYVGMKNKQNGVGGGRTCVWDKVAGKRWKMGSLLEESSRASEKRNNLKNQKTVFIFS